ncbi:MAG: cellulose binding domain-containing protein [Lachnospiraceae bacterium]|nr:cellulose binding domain-containing protein [Lachnospiraceae bacterium]
MKNYITRALSVIMSIIICISFTFGGNAMAIAETISGDASSDASSNAVPMATDFNNDVYTFKDKNAGVKVLVAKKDSWDNGYIAGISIENTGDEALVNWHIDLKVKGEIDSVWNSEYEIKDDVLKLSYPTWSRKIKSGESYTFGMKVKGDFNNIGAFKYYEDAKDVSELYKIEYKVENTWDGHAIIKAIITNTGETMLRDWTLNIAYDADIVDIWNASISSHEANLYMLKNKEYNADIEPNQSVTLGFQAQYAGNDIVLPASSKLIAVADSKLIEVETDKVDWYRVMTNADSPEATRMRDSVKDRVKVAIIDSGVDFLGENDEINRVDFIGDTDEENPIYDDRSGHGTGVAGMLLGVNNDDENEEEETIEEEPADVDFSYLTDADYIEPVDTPEDDEEFDVSDDDEEYDDDESEYFDYDDL